MDKKNNKPPQSIMFCCFLPPVSAHTESFRLRLFPFVSTSALLKSCQVFVMATVTVPVRVCVCVFLKANNKQHVGHMPWDPNWQHNLLRITAAAAAGFSPLLVVLGSFTGLNCWQHTNVSACLFSAVIWLFLEIFWGMVGSYKVAWWDAEF